MDWLSHFAIGFLLTLLAFYFITPNHYEIVFLAFFAGGSALLPDIDHSDSKVKKLLDKLIIFVAIIFTWLFYCREISCLLSEEFALRTFAFVGAYFIIFTFFGPKHRGITHSLLLCLFFTAIIWFILGWKFALAGGLGYFSHLLADREIKLL